MEQLREELAEIVLLHEPVTCRQTFYLAVSAGLIPKNEKSYKNVICRLLGDMRRDGRLPWGSVVDYTRVMRKPRTYDTIKDALAETARIYRRDIWQDINARVEVWSEKEALTGVLIDETWRYDVPLMTNKGYPSLSFLYAAGEAIRAADCPTFLYYIGDHDPSGKDISRFVDETIREFAPEAEIHFERLAVLPEQITSMGLPTRPTKQTDSRARNFKGESVEADAILPDVLRGLVREAIESHIPDAVLERHEAIEESERRVAAWRVKYLAPDEEDDEEDDL